MDFTRHFSQNVLIRANTDTDILNSPGNMKYLSSLIYIAPLYHKKFSALSRLVLLVTDLMFQSPIRDLWRQTLAFSPGQCSVSASPPTSRPTTGTGWRRSEAIGRTLTSGGRARAPRASTPGWRFMTSAASATVGNTTSSSKQNRFDS